MVTIIHKKKGFYKHFRNYYDGMDYMRENGINWHFVNIIKDHKEVKHTNFYRFITVIEVS